MTETSVETPPNAASGTTVQACLEAVLFISDEPIPLKRLCELVEVEIAAEEVQAMLQEMARELEEDATRGLKLLELAGGWQLATKPDTAEAIDRLLTKRKSRTLGEASLETLAIVAYKQPVTRAEIENIRGVSVEGALHTLLQRRLIRLAGRKDVPGRPYLYRTTKEFLKYFGLPSLGELPNPEDFKPPEEDDSDEQVPAETDAAVQPKESDTTPETEPDAADQPEAEDSTPESET